LPSRIREDYPAATCAEELLMSIRFRCTTCGKELKTAPEHAGKRVKCPSCGNVINVPEEVLDAEAVPPPTPADAADPGYGLAPSEPAPPADDRIPCPACGEMIKANAVKCRFCGEIFDETLRRAEKKRSGGEDANLTGGEWVLAILCSGIGCIMGLVWMIQGKPKGTKMFGISFLFVIIWNIVNVLIQASLNPRGLR
jgi:predicted RNA-binding Zn-ribbon protein involved in translation (DUF1610 family)